MSELPVLDAVLLDAGGTLVRLDYEWMAEALRELGVYVDAATIRRGEIAGRKRYDASRGMPQPPGDLPQPLGGVGDIRAYFIAMLQAAGVPMTLLARALERFFARHEERGLWSRPMEGARETLDVLADRGVRCAVVSNSDGRAEHHLRDCDVLRGVEFVVDSHLVGIEKPDPGIFRIALERMDVEPRRAIFVGDIRSVDEAGARAAGMHFVLLDPYRDYAGPGTPSIDGIRDLGPWLESRFRVGSGSGKRMIERA